MPTGPVRSTLAPRTTPGSSFSSPAVAIISRAAATATQVFPCVPSARSICPPYKPQRALRHTSIKPQDGLMQEGWQYQSHPCSIKTVLRLSSNLKNSLFYLTVEHHVYVMASFSVCMCFCRSSKAKLERREFKISIYWSYVVISLTRKVPKISLLISIYNNYVHICVVASHFYAVICRNKAYLRDIQTNFPCFL